MDDDIKKTIGTAFYDKFGSYCKELISAGYDLNDFYNAGTRWGDFSRVLIKVAQLRGVTSYDNYVHFIDTINLPDHAPASKQLFARVTGIYTPRTNTTQTDRTRAYRKRTMQELKDLREATALAWIDNNLEQAKAYISDKITDKKQ